MFMRFFGSNPAGLGGFGRRLGSRIQRSHKGCRKRGFWFSFQQFVDSLLDLF
jgi:hypothetical protein